MKDIKGYENLYAVTEDGRVWGYKKKHFLKPSGKRYYHVVLCKDGVTKTFNIHRLVAEAFLPNPNNLPLVNHKDENPFNNCVDNLEWCDNSYNNSYGNRLRNNKKPVYCI